MKPVEQQAGGVEPQEANQHSYEVYTLKTKTKEREEAIDEGKKNMRIIVKPKREKRKMFKRNKVIHQAVSTG